MLTLGCGTTHHLPTEDTHVTTIIKDSIRWKDSTIYVQVPVERYVDVVPVYDTLKLESTLARSVSYVDTTTHTLKGKLEQTGDVKTVIKYKDRIVTEYRDSISIKEIPVEVEVPVRYAPKFYKFTLVWFILSILALAGIAYLKFVKP